MSDMLIQGTDANPNRYFCNAREFAIGGHSKMIFANLRGPTSYETGGVKLDPQALGAGTKGKIVHMGSVLSDNGTYILHFRRVSLTEVRVVWTVRATGAEVANTTDLDAVLVTGVPIIFIP